MGGVEENLVDYVVDGGACVVDCYDADVGAGEGVSKCDASCLSIHELEKKL